MKNIVLATLVLFLGITCTPSVPLRQIERADVLEINAPRRPYPLSQ